MVDEGTPLTVTVEREALTDEQAKKLPKLLTKAQTGDKKALEELRPLLDRAGLWDYVGDLGRRVRDSWLESMTRHNKLVREGYERRTDNMRRELTESGDSPLERLLVDRVILTWLQVCHADMAYSVLLGSGDGYSYKEGAFQLERLDRANARHLKAVKALATVRKLLVPAVQVNIGRHQIITQGAPSDAVTEPAT